MTRIHDRHYLPSVKSSDLPNSVFSKSLSTLRTLQILQLPRFIVPEVPPDVLFFSMNCLIPFVLTDNDTAQFSSNYYCIKYIY